MGPSGSLGPVVGPEGGCGCMRASGPELHPPAKSESAVMDAIAVSLRFRLMVKTSVVAGACLQWRCQVGVCVLSCGYVAACRISGDISAQVAVCTAGS